MSMMVSFVLSFFPRDVLDEILNLIESVSEDFPSYSCKPAPSYVVCLEPAENVFAGGPKSKARKHDQICSLAWMRK